MFAAHFVFFCFYSSYRQPIKNGGNREMTDEDDKKASTAVATLCKYLFL